jgi:hypothetical protein
MTHFVKTQAAQGDMLIERVAELPKDVVPVAAENGKFIVAHSETGHHHVVKEQTGVKFYQSANDNFTCWLVVDNVKCLIEHERSFDTHKPLGLKDGIYRVRRQREYIPEGFRRAAD